jgi:hypothetical protein
LSVRTLDGAVKHGVGRAEFVERVTDHVRNRRMGLELF